MKKRKNVCTISQGSVYHSPRSCGILILRLQKEGYQNCYDVKLTGSSSRLMYCLATSTVSAVKLCGVTALFDVLLEELVDYHLQIVKIFTLIAIMELLSNLHVDGNVFHLMLRFFCFFFTTG